MITGKGTFSDILKNFSSSSGNNRRISISSLFFSSCTWKKYYLRKLRIFLKTSDFNASNGALFKSYYEKRGIIYPQFIDTEIDQSWERNPYMYISSQSGFLSMPYIVPCALGANKYFHRISDVSESVLMIRTFQ